MNRIRKRWLGHYLELGRTTSLLKMKFWRKKEVASYSICDLDLIVTCTQSLIATLKRCLWLMTMNLIMILTISLCLFLLPDCYLSQCNKCMPAHSSKIVFSWRNIGVFWLFLGGVSFKSMDEVHYRLSGKWTRVWLLVRVGSLLDVCFICVSSTLVLLFWTLFPTRP